MHKTTFFLIIILCFSINNQVFSSTGDSVYIERSTSVLAYELKQLPATNIEKCDQWASSSINLYGFLVAVTKSMLEPCLTALDAEKNRLYSETPMAKQNLPLAIVSEWQGTLNLFALRETVADQAAIAMLGERYFATAFENYQDATSKLRILIRGNAFISHAFNFDKTKSANARTNIEKLIERFNQSSNKEKTKDLLPQVYYGLYLANNGHFLFQGDGFLNKLEQINEILNKTYHSTQALDDKLTLGLILLKRYIKEGTAKKALFLQLKNELLTLAKQTKNHPIEFWLHLKTIEIKTHQHLYKVTVFDETYKKLLKELDDFSKRLEQTELELFKMDILLLKYDIYKTVGFMQSAEEVFNPLLNLLKQKSANQYEQIHRVSKTHHILSRMGDYYIETQDWKNLESLLLAYQQSNIYQDKVLINLAGVYIHNKRYQEAIMLLKDKTPTLKSDAWDMNLALAYYGKGQLDKAIDVLDDDNKKSSLYPFYSSLVALTDAKKSRALFFDSAVHAAGSLKYTSIQDILTLTLFANNQNTLNLALVNIPAPVFFKFSESTLFNSDFFKSGYPQLVTVSKKSRKQLFTPTLVPGEAAESLFFSTLSSLSNNGKLLVTVKNKQMTLWEVETGLPIRKLKASNDISSLVFVHDDAWLAVTSSSLITIWDLKTGKQRYSLARSFQSWFEPIYLSESEQLIYQNEFGQLVKADIKQAQKSKSYSFEKQITAITADEASQQLFISFNNPSPSGAPSSSTIQQFLLPHMEVIATNEQVPGMVKQLHYIAKAKRLLIMSKPGFFSTEKMPIQQLAVEMKLKLLPPLHFKTNVNRIMPEIDGNHVLLTMSSEKASSAFQNRMNVKTAVVEEKVFSDQVIFAISKNNKRALMRESSTWKLVSWPERNEISELSTFSLPVKKAFFDELTGVITFSSSHWSGSVHLWDSESGQEYQRVNHGKSVYLNNQLFLVPEKLEKDSTEMFFSKPAEGKLVDKKMIVLQSPELGYSQKLNYISSSEGKDYIVVDNGYVGSSVNSRLMAIENKSAMAQLFSWTITGETIKAVSKSLNLIVTQKDNSVLMIRSLDKAKLIREITLSDDRGWQKDFKDVWLDPKNKRIWVTTHSHFYGLTLEGDVVHQYKDEIGRINTSLFSHDLAYITIAYDVSGSTLLKFIQRDTGAVKSSHVLLDREIQHLNHSTKNNYLLLSRNDGGVEIWDNNKNETLMTLYVLPDNHWLVVDSSGRYDSSRPGDLPALSWRLPQKPLSPLPVEVFMREFYEPRLLARRLNNSTFQAVPDLSEINTWQAKIKITEIQPVIGTEQVDVTLSIDLQADLTNTDQRVFDLRLLRNGQQVAVYPKDHGEISMSDNHLSITLKDIALPPTRQNESIEFSAMAFNSDGVKSQTTYFSYTPENEIPANKAKVYLLSIGINQHTNSSWDLSYAVNDAKVIQQSISQSLIESGHYQSVEKLALLATDDHFVTKRDIEQALKKLAKKITPHDRLIFTWSGHGYADDQGQFHLLTSELGESTTRVVSPELLQHSVDADTLSRWLEQIDAGDITFIIDACNSAASVNGQGFKPGPMASRGFGQLAWFKGMQVLTASQADDVALESDQLGHGLLTFALVKEGTEVFAADHLPVDQKITTTEWLNYGKQRVPELFYALRDNRLNSVLLKGRGLDGFEANTSDVIEPQLPGFFNFSRHKKPSIIAITK